MPDDQPQPEASETGGGAPAPVAAGRAGKSASAFRTIGEVAEDLDLPPHVLRFWESKFPQLRPLKRGGGRRYYRPEDIVLLRRIRQCLYQDGYTIRGVQKLLVELSATGSALSSDPVSTPTLFSGGGSAMPDDAVTADATPPEGSGPGDLAAAAQRKELLAELAQIRRELRKARALLTELLQLGPT